MSPTVQKFLELERKKAEYKKFVEELSAATEALANELGVGSYFQDPSDGTVFKVIIPDGRFVYYEQFSYARTRRAGEKRGDLSMKEAQEAGFSVGE